MNESIGKLIWNRAVREYAAYPSNGNGEVIIKVPVVFENIDKRVLMDYEYIKRRIVLAVCNRLFKDNKNAVKGDVFASAEAVIFFNHGCNDGEAIITLKTLRLDVWQVICNNKFKGNEL